MEMLSSSSARPWPSEDQIAAVHAYAGRGLIWTRHWSRFDFDGCAHEASMILETAPGWIIEVCVECGHPKCVGCACPEMEWNEAGTLLRCKTCGKDGT